MVRRSLILLVAFAAIASAQFTSYPGSSGGGGGGTINSGAEDDVMCYNASDEAVPCVTGSFFYSGGTLHFTPTAGKFRLPSTNDQTSPTLQFGDGDTGFWEEADDVLAVSLLGALKFKWQGEVFRANLGAGLINESASATNPTVLTSNDADTGLGSAGADILSLIAGGVEGIRITESGSAITNTFNGKADFTNHTGGVIDFGSINDGACAEDTFTYTGVAAGDPLAPAWPAALETGLFGNMIATATNTVTVRLCNLSGAPVDPASATFGAVGL